MKDYQLLPPYSKDLIEQLDELIPERSPSPTDGERQIWMYAGKRDLIRNLKRRLENTENDNYQE